jgi:hypothetical protein
MVIHVYCISESFPVSKSKPMPKGPSLFCPWGCGTHIYRRQEWNRHILEFHLPHHLYCLNPACDWQGCRIEDLFKHIDKGPGNCGPRPVFEEQRMIYDTKLLLSWILDGISIDVVQMMAVDLVEERTRELEKVNLWENPRIKIAPK